MEVDEGLEKYAEKCLAMALSSVEDIDKALWLTLAQSWSELGEQVASVERTIPDGPYGAAAAWLLRLLEQRVRDLRPSLLGSLNARPRRSSAPTACRFACRWSLSHWRGRLGAKLELLLAETLRVAHQASCNKSLARVTVNTTVIHQTSPSVI